MSGVGIDGAEVVGQAVDLAFVVFASSSGVVVVASTRLVNTGARRGIPSAAGVVSTSGFVPESAAILQDTIGTRQTALFVISITTSGVGESTTNILDASSRSGAGVHGASSVHGAGFSSAEAA